MTGYPEPVARLVPIQGAEPRVLAYGGHPDQVVELWLPEGEGPFPVVALLHGGYWRERYRFDQLHALAADLRSRGLAAWNQEYRRSGGAGGWPATFEDVAAGFDAILDHATEYRLDPTRVAAVGHSAGGHLALWLAARTSIAPGPGAPPRLLPTLAVSLAGVCDLHEAARRRLSDGAAQELMGGEPADLAAAYRDACPRANLPFGIEQLLVHGTADENVPPDLSEQYATTARTAGDPCDLLTFTGVDHFAVIDPTTEPWHQVAKHLVTRLS